MAVVDDLGHSGMDVPPPSEDFGRQPPQDAAAEQAVLGGMLLSKDAIADVLERLRPGDFYRPAHQNVYDAVLDLYGRGEPADAVTVAAELDRRGLLRRIGGAPYLHTLISTVPTAANAGFYAGIVAEKALLRRLVEAGTRVVQYGYAGADGADVTDIVDRAQAEIYDVTEGRDVGGLRAAGTAAAADDGRDRRDRIQRRYRAWCADRVRGTRRGDQRSASGSDDHHRGEAWCREGAESSIRRCRRRRAGRRWATSPSAIYCSAPTGKPTRVVAATDVMFGRPCYEVEFADGTVIVADALHQWPTSRGVQITTALRPGVDVISATRAPVLAIAGGRRPSAWGIDAVRRTASVPVRCVEVANADHLYLAGPGDGADAQLDPGAGFPAVMLDQAPDGQRRFSRWK